jgi:hypothetical protein
MLVNVNVGTQALWSILMMYKPASGFKANHKS